MLPVYLYIYLTKQFNTIILVCTIGFNLDLFTRHIYTIHFTSYLYNLCFTGRYTNQSTGGER